MVDIVLQSQYYGMVDIVLQSQYYGMVDIVLRVSIMAWLKLCWLRKLTSTTMYVCFCGSNSGVIML